jgi:hypothetical protein
MNFETVFEKKRILYFQKNVQNHIGIRTLACTSKNFLTNFYKLDIILSPSENLKFTTQILIKI